MPLYEYHCQRCTSSFELLRPMSASREEADCPRCEAPAPRVLSVFAATTTGSGVGEAPSAIAGISAGGAMAPLPYTLQFELSSPPRTRFTLRGPSAMEVQIILSV